MRKHQKSAAILDLKYKIFGLCYSKMTEEINSFMPECGSIYSTLEQNFKYVFQDALRLIKLLKSNEVELESR